MNYRRQANSIPTKNLISSNSSGYCENKESILHSSSSIKIRSPDLPLHRQITQRLQSDPHRKHKDFSKNISPISTTSHKSKLLHVFDNLRPSSAKAISFPYKSISAMAKSPAESFNELSEFKSIEPKSSQGQGSSGNTNRLSTTPKDLYQEKDKLINQLKALAERLKTPTSSRTRDSHTKENSQDRLAYEQILKRIEELNLGYQRFLVQSQPEELLKPPSPFLQLPDDESPNVFEKVEIEKKTNLFHELEVEMQHVKDQIKHNGEMLLSIQELQTHPVEDQTPVKITPKVEIDKSTTPSKRSFMKSPKQAKGEFKEEMDRLEKEKREYARKKLEDEQKLKNKKLKLEKKNEELLVFQDELNKKQEEMIDREKKLELGEKSFEKLTQSLEKQSEELMKQKIEYNLKVETFNKNLQKFEREKNDFLKYEKDFYSRNIDLKGEYGKLETLKKEIYFEKEAIEAQKAEELAKIKELATRESKLHLKEEEMKKVEKVINERSIRVEDELATLNKEKFDFMQNVETLEKRMKDKQEQLAEWEKSLNARKEMYDDIEIKLLGMKLNEEMWQKKRDMEVANLQEKITTLSSREKELEKKEQKLNKLLHDNLQKKKFETSTPTATTTGNGAAISKLRFSVTTPTSPTFLQESPKKGEASISTSTPQDLDTLSSK